MANVAAEKYISHICAIIQAIVSKVTWFLQTHSILHTS